MRRTTGCAACAALAITLLPSGLMAQAAPAPATAAATTDKAAPERDPAAIAALERMGASLRKLTSFEVSGDATTEEVLTTGQKIQYSGTIEIKARRPDRLRVDSHSDRKSRNIYYDGKSVTVFAPNLGFYGSVPAPATIREMLTQAQAKHGIEFPLADLFDLGQDPALTARITSAFHAGAEHIGGVLCDQYAMRQPNVDWQIWISQGEQALPYKMVITSTDDPSMPQYVAVMKWNPAAALTDADFTFQPPEKAKKITIGTINPN